MRKIRTRIVLLSCIICIGSIFLATIINYTTASQHIKGETFGRLDEISRKNADRIEDWFSVQQRLLLGVHDDIQYNEFFKDDEALVSFLGYKNKSNHDVKEYYIAYPDNTFLTADGIWLPDPSYHVENRDWYKNAVKKGDVYLSSPYVDANHGGLIVTMSIPLHTSSGAQGVLGVDIYTHRIIGLLDETKDKFPGYLFIVDNNDNILAHPHSEYLIEGNLEAFTSARDIYDTHYLDVKIGDKKLNKHVDFDQVSRIVSFTEMGAYDWKIGLAIDEKAIVEPLEEIIKNTAALTVILILISVMLTLLWATSIANPVKEAKKIIDKIAHGDISEMPSEALSSRDDEIGSMFESICQIINSLKCFLEGIESISSRVSVFSSKLSLLTLKTSAEADSLYNTTETIAEAKGIRTEKISNLENIVVEMEKSMQKMMTEIVSQDQETYLLKNEVQGRIITLRKEIQYVVELGQFDIIETNNAYQVIDKQRAMLEEISSASQCLDELTKELNEYIKTFKK